MASHNELIHLNMHESGGDPADDWSHWQRDTICDIYKCLKWSVESQNHAFAHKHNIKSKMQSNISDRNKSWLLYNGMYRMTSSNGNIFRVTGPLCGEFTGYLTGEFPAQRPVTRIFDVFFDLRLNIRLSKHREAVDLGRHRAHYDVIVMYQVEASVNKMSAILQNIWFPHDTTPYVVLFRTMPYIIYPEYPILKWNGMCCCSSVH